MIVTSPDKFNQTYVMDVQLFNRATFTLKICHLYFIHTALTRTIKKKLKYNYMAAAAMLGTKQ